MLTSHVGSPRPSLSALERNDANTMDLYVNTDFTTYVGVEIFFEATNKVQCPRTKDLVGLITTTMRMRVSRLEQFGVTMICLHYNTYSQHNSNVPASTGTVEYSTDTLHWKSVRFTGR